MVCVAKCSQIKQNMVNLEASSRSEVSCQATAWMNRGFIMNFSGLSLWLSLSCSPIYVQHTLSVVSLQRVSQRLINEPFLPLTTGVSRVEQIFFLFLSSYCLVLLHRHVQSRQPEGFGAAHGRRQRLWRVGGCHHTSQVPFSTWPFSPSSTNGNVLKRKSQWPEDVRDRWMEDAVEFTPLALF